MNDTMITTRRTDGSLTVEYYGATIVCKNNFVARCVGAVAYENLPDAEWAAAVLNEYGHLVPHPSRGALALKSQEPPRG